VAALVSSRRQRRTQKRDITKIFLTIPHALRDNLPHCIHLIKRLIVSAQLRRRFVDVNELNLTSFTTNIVSAYVVHNTLSRDQLPTLIGSVHAALNEASARAGEPPEEELKPAVPIKKSVTDDYIICLEDGRKFKSLKRHLRSHYDMTPDEYRGKWGLPRDYPMVAPAYAAARSQLAKTLGLGQRRRAEAAVSSEASSKAAKGGAKRTGPAAKNPRK
jgi:predicted transcriptional regulator